MSEIQRHLALASLFPFGAPIYLLIDPYLGDPVASLDAVAAGDAESWRAQLATSWERAVYSVKFPLAEKVGLQPHQLPYLVMLEGPDDPLLAESLGMAQFEDSAASEGALFGAGNAAFRIGGWLQSGQAPESVANWLAECMRLRAGGSTSGRYLRLADRRVLALARHVLGDEQLTRNLGPIERWAYLDPWGAIDRIERREEGSPRLPFAPQQWMAMEHGEWVHRAIAQARGFWLEQGRAKREDFHVSLLAAQKMRLFFDLWPHRIASDEDQVSVIALTLIRPDWEQHPAVSALLGPPTTHESRIQRKAPDPGAVGTISELLPAIVQSLFAPQVDSPNAQRGARNDDQLSARN
jgi:hypothetical protein